MNIYRVTYTESIFREAIVEASGPDEATEAARAAYLDAAHHHAVDLSVDDFEAEPFRPLPVPAGTCFECGKPRE